MNHLQPGACTTLYKDAFTGDVLFTDDYPVTVVKDCFYEVIGSVKIGTDGMEYTDVVADHLVAVHFR